MKKFQDAKVRKTENFQIFIIIEIFFIRSLFFFSFFFVSENTKEVLVLFCFISLLVRKFRDNS